ncbi:hypothetical protein, partial [Streptomyces filamentosus]|uniref:hypothetical protein n=1 Tax=Streptomyces filamentosus TaxID=67294 RepID=UPI0033C480FA
MPATPAATPAEGAPATTTPPDPWPIRAGAPDTGPPSGGGLPFQEFYWGSWVRDARPVDRAAWNRDDLGSYL